MDIPLLLWERGRAQGHTFLKGVQFTFCSRIWSNFISALIDSRWTSVHFPLAIHYESWPCCWGEWRAVRGAVCESILLGLEGIALGPLPAKSLLENGATVRPATLPTRAQSHPLKAVFVGGIWWKWSIKLGVFTFLALSLLGWPWENYWSSLGLNRSTTIDRKLKEIIYVKQLT